MTRFKEYRLPCPHCRSSDAYHISERDDGTVFGYCFSCRAVDNIKDEEDLSEEEGTFTYQYVEWRGITRETMEAFGVLTKVDNTGNPVAVAFPYGPEAVKVRSRERKEFYSKGDMKNTSLFGVDKFTKGSSRSITITEGELDALSVYQMLGSAYPVVSVRSASSAEADCKKQRDYLNSFEKIYLCFDNDQPGNEAKKQVARLFDFNKVYDVQLSKYKDANEYLVQNESDAFKRTWWNSKRFLPEGIISEYSEFDQIIDNANKQESTATYPFKQVQELTYGIRRGEVVLFTALEGIGKTEIIRSIEYHLLKSTDANIGLIHLEEDKSRNLKGLAGYELKAPVHLPDSQVTDEEIKSAIRSLTGRDERLHIYNHFGSDDPQVILDTIRFLVTSCNCQYIFFDHITMAVSGLGDDDERKALDFISTRLAMMVKELNFALFLVSHVNDEGKTRGSRNISKIADCWIHLHRNQQADTEEQRNTTYLEFRKNRFGARTGPAGTLHFNLSTFMITDQPPILMPPIG